MTVLILMVANLVYVYGVACGQVLGKLGLIKMMFS